MHYIPFCFRSSAVQPYVHPLGGAAAEQEVSLREAKENTLFYLLRNLGRGGFVNHILFLNLLILLVVGPLRSAPSPFHLEPKWFIFSVLFFCLVVKGVTPPPIISGPTTKKTLFLYVCLPLGLGF